VGGKFDVIYHLEDQDVDGTVILKRILKQKFLKHVDWINLEQDAALVTTKMKFS
jgi:hypothetical protein